MLRYCEKSQKNKFLNTKLFFYLVVIQKYITVGTII